MTLKELSQLYYLNREIEKDKERLADLRSRAAGFSPSSLSGPPHGNGSGSKIERIIEDIVDLEAIILAKQEACIHERNRLEHWIADIDDSLLRMIFALRFVDCLSWRQVAFHIGNNTEDSVKKACYRYLKNERKE